MNQRADEPVAKQLEKEEAAHEKRNWIRLTSMCNNLCTFCLDTLAHNGTITSDEEVKKRIIDGRRKGATRLILSGGEPTIHPSYVKFIKLGRLAGYRRVQTVTNGRMFSYPEFLNRCLDAGLQEITFSIHGHNAKVHDALVGVPGAFEEEVKGLEMALADGRPIINIDVCLNKGNIKKLPELLDKFIGMGVKEYDLLHLIPFGMAWDEKHRNQLVYDIEEAMPYVQHALKVSERPDIHIWFNRFPPPYLEGYEGLIQDPYKLNDEVRGRYEEYELWITRDMPISCREPERCGRCYLKNVCDNLEDSMQRLRRGDFEAWRVRLDGKEQLQPEPHSYSHFWLEADTVQAAVDNLNLGQGELVLYCKDWSGFEEAYVDGKFAGRSLKRVLVDQADNIAPMMAMDADFEVSVLLTVDTAPVVIDSYQDGHPRLAVVLPNYERASEAEARIPDLPAFFEAWTPGSTPVENIPECVSGVTPRPRLKTVDAGSVRVEDKKFELTPGDTGGRGSLLKAIDETVGDPAKQRLIQERLGLINPKVEGPALDVFGWTGDYIRNGYYSKSLRCNACPKVNECEGLHISTLRAKGYSITNPIEADAAE